MSPFFRIPARFSDAAHNVRTRAFTLELLDQHQQ